MTDTEINIAIAECCGWHDIDPVRVNGPEGYKPDCEGDVWSYVPNYCADLNAMHEAIMSQPGSIRVSINHVLMETLRPNEPFILDRTINATSRQRAEAFLKTLGKWKE
jgi:hypothetical protein